MQHSPRATIPLLVRRLVRRHYRLIAAALLCAAAGLTVHELTPAPLETVPVVTAATDLPAGTILADSDLVTGSLPASAVPSGSAGSVHDLAGKRLATALRAGSPVLDTSIVGPGLLAGSPPGTVAVPVRPADQSTVQLLSPGQRVDIVLSTGNGYEEPAASEVLANDVPVLWKAGSTTDGSGLLGRQESEGLVVVAASPTEATALASASSRGKVFLVLVG